MTTCILQKRRGRKYDQVLQGARDVFLRDGYDGANVDEIARVAAVSKATLYNYFPDKRLLFLEVARQEFSQQPEAAGCIVQPDLAPRAMLELAAGRIVATCTAPLSVAIFRLCISEAERFPDLARDFYEQGPLMAQNMLSGYLEQAVARRELVIDDIPLAANQFLELCKAGIFARQMLCPGTEIDPDLADKVAHEAVETFLARYGKEDREQAAVPASRTAAE
ncbi:TetR/AcrR family transcriptional regulator [Pseudooceanicola algae]|uniref:TetR/AcrR family transcriptional regulator n=1 Tax=Pseudooceanicola algae TaxID=1537215 RepID=UPI001E4F518E|nr:TetR/AcrR family transcriptional regulator [Pseudooceanicola algae]